MVTRRETIDDDHKKKASLSNFKRSLIAGFLSGSISKYCGHPLDTVKTRMQLSTQNIGIIQHPAKPENEKIILFRNLKGMLPKLLRKDGIIGLYRGATSPIIATAPIVALQFATNDFSRRLLKESNFNLFLKEFLPGCCAGVIILIFAVPMELLKIRKQGKNGKDSSYPQIMKELTKEKGPLGLYRGFWSSFWSITPRSGVYFYSYPKMKQFFKKFDINQEGRKRHRIILDKFFAGG
jgi:solute carrier family 25 (mitochondrial carnitine/acylcarnitine transporter), member 20/29